METIGIESEWNKSCKYANLVSLVSTLMSKHNKVHMRKWQTIVWKRVKQHLIIHHPVLTAYWNFLRKVIPVTVLRKLKKSLVLVRSFNLLPLIFSIIYLEYFSWTDRCMCWVQSQIIYLQSKKESWKKEKLKM